MPEEKTLTKFLSDTLTGGGWLGITDDETQKTITCAKGEILSFSKANYCLKFFSYSSQKREFYERDKYKEIKFPESFDIKKYLYFKNNGNYKLSCETQFKKVINPLNKEVETIKITTGSNVKRFYGTTLTISQDIFTSAIKDAENIYKKRNSYASSIENYLASIDAVKYGQDLKQKTTYIEKGEFAFTIDRLNLKTKKSKKDFEKYIDTTDLNLIETFVEQMIKHDVFSKDFLRKLNDYFIKERLKDIVALGKKILLLGKEDLQSTQAQEILAQLDLQTIGQLENLWQQFFERYLLYLIFSYKKIFPKVGLKDIEGSKKYPDFIGINHYNGLDVIEIKTHLAKILVWDSSHENFYFSPEMSKAIVQTTNYLDSITRGRFESGRDRNKITNFVEEENLYHPRGIIIISSNKRLTTKKGEDEKLKRDFTKLRNSLHNIEILTFDEIIGIADEYIKNIIKDIE